MWIVIILQGLSMFGAIGLIIAILAGPIIAVIYPFLFWLLTGIFPWLYFMVWLIGLIAIGLIQLHPEEPNLTIP